MHRFTALAFAAITATAVAASSPFTEKYAKSRDSRKAKMTSNLLQHARPTENSQLHRGLDEEYDDGNANGNIDLTKYVFKFAKCQFVKAYDDELAETEGAATVLNVKRYVVFRLCPLGTCNSCNQGYGEYVIDMDTYLTYTIPYYYDARENSCDMCEALCEANDDVTRNAASKYVDCNTCEEYCEFVENMDQEEYVESAEYAQCVQVYEDDYDGAVYAGAMCANDGATLKIAAFSDDACSQHKKNVDVQNYLEGVTLNRDILGQASDPSSCTSCITPTYGADDDSAGGTNELCSYLYDGAAKCESQYGMDNYWKNYAYFSNQYVQEDLVCDFIDSLGSGTYDQYGEIVLSGTSVDSKVATGGQQFCMVLFVLGTIGIGVYATQLKAQLKSPKTDLSSQGGALA